MQITSIWRWPSAHSIPDEITVVFKGMHADNHLRTQACQYLQFLFLLLTWTYEQANHLQPCKDESCSNLDYKMQTGEKDEVTFQGPAKFSDRSNGRTFPQSQPWPLWTTSCWVRTAGDRSLSVQGWESKWPHIQRGFWVCLLGFWLGGNW